MLICSHQHLRNPKWADKKTHPGGMWMWKVVKVTSLFRCGWSCTIKQEKSLRNCNCNFFSLCFLFIPVEWAVIAGCVMWRLISKTTTTNSHDKFTCLSVCITPLHVDCNTSVSSLVRLWMTNPLMVEQHIFSCSLRNSAALNITPLS